MVISLAGWLLGFVLSYYSNVEAFGVLLPLVSELQVFALLTIIAFIFSVFFYGRLSVFILFLLGFIAATSLEINVLVSLLSFIPFVIASYAGSMLGSELRLDLKGKGNAYLKWRTLGLYFAAGLIIAIIIGLSAGFLPVQGLSDLHLTEAFREALKGLSE